MAVTAPRLRKLKLTLGPLEEWRGPGSQGEIIEVLADGATKTFKITASVNKTVMGVPNPSTITIFNLRDGTRSAIQKSLTKVVLEAGWENTTMHRVLQGSVLSAVSERSGADIVTKIAVLPGFGGMLRGTSSKTFSQGTPIKDVVKALTRDMPGINSIDSLVRGVNGTIGPGGWSFAGSTKDGLTQLANEYGFSWTIDDGALRALGDKTSFENMVILNGENGGLMGITPVMQGPMQIQTGVKIKALYVPNVQAGGMVRVKSTVTPKLSGDYKVHTMNISLDTHSDAWNMDLDSFRNF